jgi:hypothetical protein
MNLKYLEKNYQDNIERCNIFILAKINKYEKLANQTKFSTNHIKFEWTSCMSCDGATSNKSEEKLDCLKNPKS